MFGWVTIMKTKQILRTSLIVVSALLVVSAFAASDSDNFAKIGLPILTNHQGGDVDNDGILDSEDQCENTENGRFVDDKGCEFDTDSDGVKNSADRCPQTPLGLKVKGNGCL